MSVYPFGIPSLATQGELIGVKPHIYEQLNERFDNIYLLFDFDKGGVKGTKKLKERIPDLKYFFLHNSRHSGYKDISDYRQDHSPRETLNHLRYSLKRWNKNY